VIDPEKFEQNGPQASPCNVLKALPGRLAEVDLLRRPTARDALAVDAREDHDSELEAKVTSVRAPARVIAGAAGALGVQAMTSGSAWAREEAARTAAREVARDAFQRETLLELQDAMLAQIQNTTKIHLHDSRAFRESGRFGRDSLPEGLNLASAEVSVRRSPTAPAHPR
jgi:hypothetical protein